MIVVATTCAPYKLDGSEMNWLTNAEWMLEDYSDLIFFAALELLHGREFSSYGPLRKRLNEFPNEVWTFSLDDGEKEVTSLNRLNRICMGRNLITEYALRREASHVLFLDSDLLIPGDAISKLLELDVAIAGGDVPNYCLSGERVTEYPFPVERHWNTAGFLLVRNEVLWRVRWRHEHFKPSEGLTDDPCYARDVAEAGFGETLVRKDVKGEHIPLIPMEDRGHDRRL